MFSLQIFLYSARISHSSYFCNGMFSRYSGATFRTAIDAIDSVIDTLQPLVRIYVITISRIETRVNKNAGGSNYQLKAAQISRTLPAAPCRHFCHPARFRFWPRQHRRCRPVARRSRCTGISCANRRSCPRTTSGACGEIAPVCVGCATIFGYLSRMYAVRKIRDTFRANRAIRDYEEIDRQMVTGQQNLELIRRQVSDSPSARHVLAYRRPVREQFLCLHTFLRQRTSALSFVIKG